MEARCAELEQQGKLLESHRLRQRTQFDMEMLRELGFCNGIENYSRILDGRAPGERPFCLLDFFPDDFLLHRRVAPDRPADRRHVRGRPLAQDDARGVRLPAPERAGQPPADLRRVPPSTRRRWCSCRPRPRDFERNDASRIVEQIVRPTGVVDPEVDVRETKNQIDDLMEEIRQRVEARSARSSRR